MSTRTRMMGLTLMIALPCMGMMAGQNGCDGSRNLPLAGVWTLQRGETEVKFTFTVNNGGEVTQETADATLEPLNPDDFPEALAALVAQWNAGLDDLNAALDEAMPDQVLVTFPGAAQMRLTNLDDESKVANGIINAQDTYLFVGDLSGQGEGDEQGGGGVITLASIEGSFDRENFTTTGQVIRRLAVVLIGSPNDAISFVVEIKVNYTGERTGDVPAS